MSGSSEFSNSLMANHLQQWFAEPMPSVSGSQATRLDSLNIVPIARASGLSEHELRDFALGQAGLPLRSLASLIIVVRYLGYSYPY